MNQYRNPESLEQERQQGRQVGLLARAAIGRQDNGANPARRQFKPVRSLIERCEKAEHFIRCHALDPQGKNDRAQLEVRHAAIEHCGVKLTCIIPFQAAGATSAAADFPDVMPEESSSTLAPLRMSRRFWPGFRPSCA